MANVGDIRPRMLMAPGPSDVNPRVLEAMDRPTVGHLDAQFLVILNDIRDMLQEVFRTRNELTLAVSGTGSAGLAPVEVIAGRETPVQSWYLGMNMVRRYWGSERLYHHTAPVNMNYALHEALKVVLEEGLPERWERYAVQHRALKALKEILV